MLANLEQLRIKSLAAIQAITNRPQFEAVESQLLGRKNGELTQVMKAMKDLPEEERRPVGQRANEVKQELEAELNKKRAEIDSQEWALMAEKERLDVSQPSLPARERGHFHPSTLLQNDLEDLFTSMGFIIADGPELESDYYNFSALNIPETHPARDSQDTFYLKNNPHWLMRTHTSPGQIRSLQKYGAPLRIVIPGKCYRNESTDSRHEHTFYQLEGLVVDKGITFSHLKGILGAVARHLYGADIQMRLLPKFYPFVEPGVRGEVTCFLCRGQGCRVCKQSGWLEIFGAGLIHPHLLKECGLDPKEYQGFAFGLGLTRLVMLRYGIEDVRLMESGKMQFLEQF